MKSWEEKKKDLSNLARQSEYSDDENYGGHGCIDSSGNTRHNAGPLPTRGCTLDKLWRDQRYEGNAAGINAE